jgi:hypothetical protein
VAQKIEEKGIVLLKNDNGQLPLKRCPFPIHRWSGPGHCWNRVGHS